MFTYFMLLCLICGVRNCSENEQISVKTKFQKININVPPTVGQTSLAIIFDCTGSMSDNLKEITQAAERLIDEFTKRPDNPIHNYIFVCFRDPDIGSAIVTTEKQVLLDTLKNVNIDGDVDCPGMTMGGILEGMKYVMDKSYVYIFTDATSKDHHRAVEVLDIIQKKQATVSFLVTDGCGSNDDFSVFKKLAVHSNGEFYDLNATDIGKVLDDLKDTVDKRLTTLKYIYEPEGKNNTIELNVDSYLEQIFISVVGAKSVIEIFDPYKQIIDATNMLQLENLNKVKVYQPDSGQWLILVGANSPHTIKITATSNITFTFGFSLNLTEKIENTVLNPIRGAENILFISPSHPNLITNLTSVNLTSSNESLTLVLNGINDEISETILYATEPFTIPFLVFKIHIFGFDQHENKLERLISTSIEAKEKSPPFIEIAIKNVTIKEGDYFSIKCHVRSVLPINVKWVKNNEELIADEFDQSESLEYTIENADESNAGEYVCSAANDKGTSDDFIQVSIEPSLLLVKIPQLEYSKAENDLIEIPCIVKSSKSYSLRWTHNNEEIHYENEYELLGNNLLIKKLSRDHEGIFICEVTGDDSLLPENASTFLIIELLNKTHEIGETETTTMYEEMSLRSCYAEAFEYIIEGKPVLNADRITKGIRLTESHELEIKRFDELSLTCPFENYDTILWYKNGDLIGKIETKDCIDDENGTLQFNHTRFNDRGEYGCIAQNQFGQNKYTYQINIIWPPKIYRSYDSISGADLVDQNKVHLNQELKLNCVVDIYPKSELIMWVKPDDNIVNGSYLHIGKVTVNEQGIYRCMALNDYGHDVKSYNLEIIKSRPKKNDFVETRKFILEGTVLLLDCQIYGYPVVSYTWYYNGSLQNLKKIVGAVLKIVKTSIHPIIKTNVDAIFVRSMIANESLSSSEYVSNDSQYLRKNAVKAEDRGWYKCLARNEIGSEENAFSVQVYNYPKITYINASTTINDFEEFNLECKAKGIPLPFIYWQLNDVESLRPSDYIYESYQSGQFGQYSISMMHGSGLLTLDRNNEISLKIVYAKNTRKKAGKYICHAISFCGRDERFVEVEVQSNPLMTPENIYGAQRINVTVGMRLTLQCPSQQNPRLYFLWRKDKKNINNSNQHIYFTNAGKHLKILQANLDDAGIYECVSSTENYAEKFFFNVSILENEDVFDNLSIIDTEKRFKRIYTAEIGKPPSFYNSANEFFSKSTGDDVHLNCSSTGNPFPIITWFKGDDAIEFLSNYNSYEAFDNNQILKISLNDFTSFGKYSCKAENYHDTIEKHFEVNHYEKKIWSNWSPCSKTCGKGTQSRWRRCLKSDIHCKSQPKIEIRDCEGVPCDEYTASGESSGDSNDDYLYQEYDEKEHSCGNGYEFKDNKCQDINECQSLQNNCDDKRYTCLNTNGSYECLPTSCKPEYSFRSTEKRYPHEATTDCIKKCLNTNSICVTNGMVAETINYAVLSLSKIPKLYEPIKTFVNYDINRRPLEHTDFRLIKSSTNGFYLKKKSNSKAISYLYVRKVLQKEKLYKLELIARSFHYQGNDTDIQFKELLYYTRYYVYIYIM